MDRAVPTSGFGGALDNTRSDREFARARRHSRLVSVLKVGLPLVAIAIIAAGIATTWLARSLPENVSVAGASIEDGRVVMEDPRMSGSDSSDRPYSMIAKRAIQSLGSDGIDLEEVRANVAVSDDATADIVATRGHYDNAAQTLRLYDDIAVETTDGMSITMREARIDLAAGSMDSEGAVRIEMPSQTIEAGSLAVANGGKRLTFGNRVKMTLTPSSGASASGTSSSETISSGILSSGEGVGRAPTESN